MFRSLLNDFRYALRQLRKSPGFTLTAVLTLAIGIGATTAIFSLIWSVMLEPLPVEHPEQLYKIGSHNELLQLPAACTVIGSIFSVELYNYLQRQHQGLRDYWPPFQAGRDRFTVRRAGDKDLPQAVNARIVSGNYFSTLGGSHAAGPCHRPRGRRGGLGARRRHQLPLLAAALRARSVARRQHGAS